MKTDPFFIEVGHFQKPKAGEHAFGDVILKHLVREERRRIVVLSDGMGSGIKANILATLTASMALNFVREHKSIVEASTLIFNMLPECSVRKMAYATFTVLDLVGEDTVHLMVYDNPLPVILRDGAVLEPEWQILELADTPYAGKAISTASYRPQEGDRLLAFSDGVSQSGLGRSTEWLRDGVIAYALKSLHEKPDYSAGDLAERLVNKAEMNDKIGLKDDASCLCVYFRKPRRLLLVTGVPANREHDFAFARHFKEFDGKKVIAGETTSEVIARELDLPFGAAMIPLNDGLPPISTLESADLVTEGVMTLSGVERLLRDVPRGGLPRGGPPRDGAAERMVKLILNADLIEFCVGTATNEFHFGLQVKLRAQLVRDIADLLETKHFKQATIEYF